MKKIFSQRDGYPKQSIHLFGEDTIRREVKEVRVDTTVQEKNITYPTDRRLTEIVIEYCKRIAEKEDIKLKRTYTMEIKKLKYQLRFARKPKNYKKLILYKESYNVSHSRYYLSVGSIRPLKT